MSFRSWFTRSLGRTREGTKAHLLATAELLGCSKEVLLAMHQADDERCEELLVEHISIACGGTADWKEHHQDIMATLAEFLTPDDVANLRAANIADAERPPEALLKMDKALAQSVNGIRGLESFGDFYIVLVMRRDLLPRFDEVNRHWLAASEA